MSSQKKQLAIQIGAKLREIRQSRGMSMTDLANEAEIEYKQLSRIELGEINTSIYQLYKISQVLNEPVNNILIDLKY